MSRIGEPANRPQPEVFSGQVDAARAHQELLRGLDGKQACPFCGSVSEKSPAPCQRCGMENTPDARKATKARIGPWYVLQARNPAAPGMRFETLLSFVRKGRVRARSVVRGPTTHQLWRFAAHVKGLSREFGLCFSCGSAIDPAANICPQCNRLQEPPLNPDALLEHEGEESSRPPVYRELPAPGDGTAAAAGVPATVAAPAPVTPPPPPEDVDIIIPALGGFSADALGPEPKFSEGPAVTPDVAASMPQQQRPTAAPRPFSIPSPGSSSASPSPRTAPGRPGGPAGIGAPQADNPFAIGGPRPKKGNGDGTFLSAKELAAAFKLSFDPNADLDSVDIPDQMPAGALPEGMRVTGTSTMPRGVGPGAGSAMQPAAAFKPAGSAATKRRSGGFRRFVLFMLILVATGLGVLLWVDPVFRQKTVDWTKASYDKLHAYATGGSAPAASPDASAGNPATPNEFDVPAPPPLPADNAATPAADAKSAPAPAPAAPGATPPPAAGASDSAAAAPAPERQDAAAADAAQASARRAAEAAEAAAAPKPQPQPPKPAPAPTAAAPAQPAPAPDAASGQQDPEAAKARAWELYKFALRAEGKRPTPDYAGAIKAYAEIQKLPRDTWPTDLEIRLTNARKKMK